MRQLRKRVPRSTFASWKPDERDRNPLDSIKEDEEGRVPELVARRRALMSADPFGFYRGTAALMASDLSTIAVTGLNVQLCGDAHVLNFGGYATPERRLVFDVNDFDETLHGPWEWDVARLCASLPLFGAFRGFRPSYADDAVFEAAHAYRKSIREFGLQSPLEVWYSSVDVRGSLAKELAPPRDASRVRAKGQLESITQSAMHRYRESLLPHVRMLLDRYKDVGYYEHDVGVGSLGLFAAIAEFQAGANQWLYLQVKEARRSVLERYLGASVFGNHGERVIAGQRAMQAASDLFLGWTRDQGVDFYVRQLRDEKTSLAVESVTPQQFVDYARRCGSVLARAHARTGEPKAIGEYLGAGEAFDESMIQFARRYASVAEHDCEMLRKERKVSAV